MKFYENLETVMKHFSLTGGFLTAKSGDGVNTMVISWGFIGFLWGKPHFVVFVRPQRYTQEIMQKAAGFTVSVPFGTMKEELGICGSKSGRDIDKSKVVAFIPSQMVESPIVKGCNAYYECVINCNDKLKGELLPEAVKTKWYHGDYHDSYIGEIVASYTNE